MVENRVQVQMKAIVYDSEEYAMELEVRDGVLRRPLGMSLYAENLEAEKADFHIGAFINNTLVGVLILTRLNEENVKMRQVAVTEAWRSNGIGRELVRFAEKYSQNMGYSTILLNARETAVTFYEKLGYEKLGDVFNEINIPHYKMRKNLSCCV